MAYQENEIVHSDIWFLESGWFNHMTGIKASFKELDETFKVKVPHRDKKQMQVDGKDTLEIKKKWPW